MFRLRYPLKSDWPFYLLVLSYAYLIINMTARLWFGDGVNIFANYTLVDTLPEFMVDANKVYWSKTCFLFSIILMTAVNVDIRAAAGIGAIFWAGSLSLIFAPNPTLVSVVVLGIILVALQIRRQEFFSQ